MYWNQAEKWLTLKLTEDIQSTIESGVFYNRFPLFPVDQSSRLLSSFFKEGKLFLFPVFEKAFFIQYELFVFIMGCGDVVQDKNTADFIDIISNTVLKQSSHLSHFSQLDDIHTRYHIAALLKTLYSNVTYLTEMLLKLQDLIFIVNVTHCRVRINRRRVKLFSLPTVRLVGMLISLNKLLRNAGFLDINWHSLRLFVVCS